MAAPLGVVLSASLMVAGIPIPLALLAGLGPGAVCGGASLMGGKGSIIGTLLGAIILGAMRNKLTLLNARAFYPLFATGLLILLAMLVDRATRGRS